MVFVLLVSMYYIDVDHSASFWDCPEYITCASLLEIGHPPGNPVWMLAMRFITIPFPPEQHAYVIGLASCVFMALAAYFIARITCAMALYIAKRFCNRYNLSLLLMPVIAPIAGAAAGVCFGACFSAWFSATEAEVYAMSAFLMALTLWLMTLWARTYNPAKQKRLLILVAYITGLSLGVHQLNLLCIPVIALMYVFRKHPYGNCTLRGWVAIAVSFIVVALILTGLMGGTIDWAQQFELTAVNSFGLPYFSGVYLYLAALLAAIVAAVIAVTKGSRIMIAISLFFFIWLSGIFVFNGNILVAAAISAATAAITAFRTKWKRDRILTCVMSLAFVLLGYSSFALILIRGYAAPPMNEGAPSDIFALGSYIDRDQYGKTPLLYGATPYSKPMVEECMTGGSDIPDYSKFALKKGKARYAPLLPGARLYPRSRAVSHADSSANATLIKKDQDGYLLSDYAFTRVTSPELDMVLPRITQSSPSDLKSYESWAGMTRESMKEVEISETFDQDGNPAGKINASGERVKNVSYRPTYMQNLKFFLSYQAGYMYFRYLLWNFMGRQNDISSTGEIDHGNFITGFSFIDNAMLGDQSLMPQYATTRNPGHNMLYGIPFLFGLLGIIFLFTQKSHGRRDLAVIAMFFFMTGLAITLYLNQSPGEPRERDYSFLGSYMAFSMWIGFGVLATGLISYKIIGNEIIAAAITCAAAFLPSTLIFYETSRSYTRYGRSEPYDFASGLLLTKSPAIIFSQGDNFTFPMWYAQEVMNTGREHTVIDVSYFATPEYVINLMKQGDRGIKLTASPADIAYGAYAYTRIAPDADTTAIPAIDALRELYSQRDGAPTFNHRRLSFPGKSVSDTLIVDLKDFANGSSMLPFRKLMLLDLLATNATSQSRRPVYFHSAISTDFYRPFAKATRKMPFVNSYDPDMPDSIYITAMAQALEPTLEVSLRDTIPTIKYDDVIMEQVRRQRGEIIITANKLLDNGMLGDAAFLESIVDKMHPYRYVPAGSFTIADSTYHEGIELATLKLKIAIIKWDYSNAASASFLIKTMLDQSRQWNNYYRSLPESRRNTVSNSTRRLISIIPVLENLQKDCDTIKTLLPRPMKR